MGSSQVNRRTVLRGAASSDDPSAGTAMFQVSGQKTRVVWPTDVAGQQLVFPRPQA